MNSAWENAKRLAEKHANQGSIFLRLQNDGDTALGVFCGDPHAREVYWDGDKYVDAVEGAPPPPGATTKTPSLRVLLNFYEIGEDMKIVEGGQAWFTTVMQVAEKYGLDKWVFEIKRHGKPRDPKTKYTILPERPIDDKLRAEIASAELHVLGAAANDNGTAVPANDNGIATAANDNGGRLVDLEVARQMADRLRALPRADVDEFLAEFHIQKVRDLPNALVPAALRFLLTREEQRKDPLAL